MNKPIYEIPMGDGDQTPAPGRRAAAKGYDASTPGYTPAPSQMEAAGFPPPSMPGSSAFALPAASSAPAFPPPVAPSFPPPAAQFPPPQAPPAAAALPPAPSTAFAAPSAPLLSDLSPSVGLGQAGSDPDLVAALNAVVTSHGSDLHVSVNAPPSIRVDGGLRAIPGIAPWDAAKVNAALLSIMSEAQRDHFNEELELDFAYTLSETSRFRVNIYLQRNVMGAAFRLIPTEIKQLAALGVPDKVGAFAQLPRGLVLVTGPTGSGKSTTLAALVDLVNQTRSDHIVTVEDPIEYMHTSKRAIVNQREVGEDTESFTKALKHVLRQDPDVILVGEMRDLETIEAAVTAAETGHLVFGTLHTTGAVRTIDRIVDAFPTNQQEQIRTQLAGNLKSVISQALVPRKSGFGRIAAYEVMICTSAIQNLIRENKSYRISSSIQTGHKYGMNLLDEHLLALYRKGICSFKDCLSRAQVGDEFIAAAKALGIEEITTTSAGDF